MKGIMILDFIRLPPRVLRNDLHGGPRQRALHCAKVQQPDLGGGDRGALRRVRLEAAEHARPPSELQQHGADGQHPLVAGHPEEGEVVPEQLLGDRQRVLGVRLQQREDGAGDAARVPAPGGEAEALVGGEEVEETLAAVGRGPLCGAVVEEDGGEVDEGVVDALSGVHFGEAEEALGRGAVGLHVVGVVEGVLPGHRLEVLQGVVVHKVLEDGLVREQVGGLVDDLLERQRVGVLLVSGKRG